MSDTKVNAPVRVSLPASVAAEIGSFKKAVGSILDKLGCEACCSGHDIYMDLQREFVFRNVADLAVPLSTRSFKPSVRGGVARVGLAPKAGENIKDVFAAIDRIADLTGHPACCSGNDLFLQMERNFVIDANFEVEEQVLRIG